MTQKYGKVAKKVPILPEVVTYNEFKESINKNEIMIGIDKSTLKPVTVNFNNSVIIIKNVPCEECEQCGEIFYTDEVAEHARQNRHHFLAIIFQAKPKKRSPKNKIPGLYLDHKTLSDRYGRWNGTGRNFRYMCPNKSQRQT